MKPKLTPSLISVQRVEHELDLQALIDGITPENVHPATDWGPDVGSERGWEDD